MHHLFIKIDFDEEIESIEKEFQKNQKLFSNICDSPIGKYSVNDILKNIELYLNFLEIRAPILKKWISRYFETNRGKLWLYYGINKGNYLTDYWKIKETNFIELSNTWSFLFDRSDPYYKGFVIDLKDAQDNIIRQRKRQDTLNPSYTPFHPDGCPSKKCCCFMLDDMEQWYEEERSEIKSSKNIFFNNTLQNDFYNTVVKDIDELKHEWCIWVPDKSSHITYSSNLTIQGHTPIQIIIEWLKNDFIYSSIVNMFNYSDTFDNIWKNIDSVGDFIHNQRNKLKKIYELI